MSDPAVSEPPSGGQGPPEAASPNRLYLARAIAWSLLVRVYFGFTAYSWMRLKGANRGPVFDIWTDVLRYWDAAMYRDIAAHGYLPDPDHRYLFGFSPGFPLLMRVAHLLIPQWEWCGFLVSLLASIGAGYFLQRLMAFDEEPETVRRGLWLLMLAPTAHFMVLPYTEALFICLTLAAFVAAREGRWFACGLLGMAVVLTRINGIIMFPAMLWEAWNRRDGRLSRGWLVLLPLSFVGMMGYCYHLIGDFKAMESVQSDVFHHQWMAPWYLLWRCLMNIVYGERDGILVVIMVPMFICKITSICVLALQVGRLRRSYQWFSWGLLIPYLCLSQCISFPRYILALFPLTILLARIKSRTLFELLAFTGLFLQTLLMMQWSNMQWTY